MLNSFIRECQRWGRVRKKEEKERIWLEYERYDWISYACHS
jgi:hypothetical protein